MQRFPGTIFALSLLVLLFLSSTIYAHNITRILAKHPEFSIFNHYLTLTHLASEINRRQTITVCAVDNAAMSNLLDKHMSIYTLKNVLSLHVFADYFGSKKLHKLTKGTTLTATLFQATGEAPGTSGYINITNLKGNKVVFATEDDNDFSANFVKSIQEIPYNISVIQLSNIITSPAAEAPVAAPGDIDLIALMKKQGCKEFAKLLDNYPQVIKSFTDLMVDGLTVFCPIDKVVNGFMPKYKNLTKDGQAFLLLYHGVPDYNSLGMLRSNNGLRNTLAKNGKEKYDFTVRNDGDSVKLETKVVTAKITGTLLDEEPLAVYKIDKVLQPTELFKAQSSATTSGDGSAPEPSSGDDDDEVPADENSNGAVTTKSVYGWLITVVLSICYLAF